MHKTIYIEADEEITSVIDRVKKEGSPDIFIVVPKNAMLVQGVISLKLLKKESAKMKKNIILVTNDKQVKKVISRIGFEIKESLSPEEIEEVPPKEELLNEVEQISAESIEEIEEQEKNTPGQREIGSSNFFADGEQDGFFNEDDENTEEELPISSGKVVKRMDIIKNQESVMDMNLEEDEGSQQTGQLASSQYSKKRTVAARRKKEVQEIFEEDIDFDGEEFQDGFSEQKAEKFFTQNKENEVSSMPPKKEKPSKSAPVKKINYFFIVGMVIILALIGFGGWAYFNWPQMNIVIYPNEKSISSVADVDVLADLSVSDIENGQLAGNMKEVEIEKTLDFNATGEKYSSDQGKSQGKVTIYNKYSSVSQPLVKTTRVLSKEGKLFRLVDSVTVPGMEGDVPGEIEVKVVADQPGSDFDIEASTFTIEGFKSGPKYETFEVFSENAMTGGTDTSGNHLVEYVTESDIEGARSETLEFLKKSFEEEMKSHLNDSRGYVLDSAKKEVIENKSSFDAGDIVDKFSYTLKQRVRLMTFDHKDLMVVAEKTLIEGLDSGYEIDSDKTTIEIIKDITDFEKMTISLKMNVFGIAWPEIDQDNFKKGIADQNEEEFGDVLKSYQEIKKVDIEYSPGWLSRISVSENKIHVSEERVIEK